MQDTALCSNIYFSNKNFGKQYLTTRFTNWWLARATSYWKEIDRMAIFWTTNKNEICKIQPWLIPVCSMKALHNRKSSSRQQHLSVAQFWNWRAFRESDECSAQFEKRTNAQNFCIALKTTQCRQDGWFRKLEVSQLYSFIAYLQTPVKSNKYNRPNWELDGVAWDIPADLDVFVWLSSNSLVMSWSMQVSH